MIREFVAQDVATARKLDRWMTSGASDVLRVNAAGILAKVGAPETVDRVIAALRVDHAMRVRYLTASRAPENLRTMAALLAGADPVTTTFEGKQ